MEVYAIHCIDKPLQQERRAALLAEHRAYLQSIADHLLMAGTLRNDDGEPIGTVVLAHFADKRAAVDFAANGPLARAGLFASVAVTAIEPESV